MYADFITKRNPNRRAARNVSLVREAARRFGINFASRQSRRVTRAGACFFTITIVTFIIIYNFYYYIYYLCFARHRRTSATNEYACSAIVKPGRRDVATPFYARWCVRVTLRALSCYLTDAQRRELCVQRKSARPLALVPSGQVASTSTVCATSIGKCAELPPRPTLSRSLPSRSV